MRCHYDILEVARNADDDVIKKAYRKLALKWHPDKNPEKIEECTQYFALLQQAYDVLSDPHERAFYDRHREHILVGGFDANYKDESLDLFQFFSASCYRNFDDGEKSFYSVYRNVFETLSNEDYDFIEDPTVRYPSFGDANSDYEMVVGPFYGFWSSFCTARSFAWLDRHDASRAKNRYELRQIENINKKFRDTGKAERNYQIRELVAFVRKRDPRIKKYRDMLEKKHMEAKQKQQENRKQQIIRNQQLASTYEESEESKADHRADLEEISQQVAEQFGEYCSEQGDQSEELPYCIVCNKFFKTENAKINHENSKQHKRQLTELKKHMKEEDAALFDSSSQLDGCCTPLKSENKKGKKAKRRAKKKKTWDSDSGDESSERNEDDIPGTDQLADSLMTTGLDEEHIDDGKTAEFVKKKRRAQKKSAVDKDEIFTARNVLEDIAPVINTGPKTGRCNRCDEFFESRSKLFEHLKQTGHAMSIPVTQHAKNKNRWK